MCGIAGFIDSGRRRNEESLRSKALCMAQALLHRGPDSGGTWVDPDSGVAFAHRRLAIVDLSPLGHQPMTSRCGRFILVFNGEIYNHRDIRQELEGLTSTFSGTSDTEVMLEAISRFGLEGAIARFNGMFAFALWDRSERKLHLARDRFGEKPLYYGWAGQTFLFASELKAFKCHDHFRPSLDQRALNQYLRLGYIPSPLSVYRDVFKLLPGSTIQIDPQEPGVLPAASRYWSATKVYANGAANPFRGTEAEALDTIESQLGDAVQLRMQADVPLGAFLSGGVDSSTVVALMQRRSSRPVKTFTIGFNTGPTEAVYAREIARHLGTDHTEFEMSPKEALDVIPCLTTMYDEPFADSSQIPTYLVSALARRHVTVSLSGDGGDEIFSGYSRYKLAQWLQSYVRIWPRPLRIAAGEMLKRVPRGLSSFIAKLLAGLASGPVSPNDPSDALRRLGTLIATDDALRTYLTVVSIWKESVSAMDTPDASLLDPEIAGHSSRGLVRDIMWLDTILYLTDDILVKLDRASMAVSLESRVPLLDHRLFEFASRLPIGGRAAGSKTLLKKVLHRHVPSKLLARPKMGFSMPISAWLRGPLRDWAEQLLGERALAESGCLNVPIVRDKWMRHLSGSQNFGNEIWVVLMLQAWLGRETNRQPFS